MTSGESRGRQALNFQSKYQAGNGWGCLIGKSNVVALKSIAAQTNLNAATKLIRWPALVRADQPSWGSATEPWSSPMGRQGKQMFT